MIIVDHARRVGLQVAEMTLVARPQVVEAKTIVPHLSLVIAPVARVNLDGVYEARIGDRICRVVAGYLDALHAVTGLVSFAVGIEGKFFAPVEAAGLGVCPARAMKNNLNRAC